MRGRIESGDLVTVSPVDVREVKVDDVVLVQRIRPQGGSMRGRIESGDLVTVSPVDVREVKVDDVVLVQWQRSYLLHRVREIRGDEFLIGNNLGKINGWVKSGAIRGRVTNVVHDAEG
ncbi:hypothetical protein [Prosthecobacter sp.]|uniref:hypothetical protein n=1 Tax=Prosthecobacter sp. TaxID=1965333 RepID=UPI003783A6AC